MPDLAKLITNQIKLSAYIQDRALMQMRFDKIKQKIYYKFITIHWLWCESNMHFIFRYL